jgi:hypothetical protein
MVVAPGGLADGCGLALALGAEGVLVGTRFAQSLGHDKSHQRRSIRRRVGIRLVTEAEHAFAAGGGTFGVARCLAR